MKNEFMKIEEGSGYLETTMFFDDSIREFYDFKTGKKGKMIIYAWFINYIAEKNVTGIKEMDQKIIKEFQINLIRFLDFLKEIDKEGKLVIWDKKSEYKHNICISIEDTNEIGITIYKDLAKIYKSEELQEFLKNVDKIKVPQKVSFNFIDFDNIKIKNKINPKKLTQEEKEYIYEQIGEAVNDCDIGEMVALLEMIYEDEEEEDEE